MVDQDESARLLGVVRWIAEEARREHGIEVVEVKDRALLIKTDAGRYMIGVQAVK